MNQPFTPPSTPPDRLVDGHALVELDDGRTGIIFDEDGLAAMRGLANGFFVTAIGAVLLVVVINAARWIFGL